MKSVLVTGGAGYIGSHTVLHLLECGYRVVVIDNLSTGHLDFVEYFQIQYDDQFTFIHLDLLNLISLSAVIQDNTIDGIIDFAAKSLVEESQKEPLLYLENNVLAFYNILKAFPDIPIVKSSTAATYGDPSDEFIPLQEMYHEYQEFSLAQLHHSLMSFEQVIEWFQNRISILDSSFVLTDDDIRKLRIPTNIYGITKLLDEIMMEHEGRKYVSLRYFNAAGDSLSGHIGEDHSPETHLIPIVLDVALGKRDYLKIFGNDYPTQDGTAIRDYISVNDLARAHVLSLEYLWDQGESQIMNLGSGNGNSVLEIVKTCRTITQSLIDAREAPRRTGDPSMLIADTNKVKKILGWEPQESLQAIVESAWMWHQKRFGEEG